MGKVIPTEEANRHLEEDILKNVKLLLLEKGTAKVSDLADRLEIKENTMYSVINRMVGRGYLEPLTPRGGRNVQRSLNLTKSGEEIGRAVLERHQLVQKWLIRLGIPEEQADQEACSLEHGMTDTILRVLKQHVEMADQYMGTDLSAGEIMRQMKESGTQPYPRADTITERSLKMIEKIGGLEGAERKLQLSEQAGGDDALKHLVAQSLRSGGTENTLRQLRVLSKLLRITGDEKRTLRRIGYMGPILKLQGNQDDFLRLAEYIQDYGGLRRVLHDWEDLIEIRRMQTEFGGMNAMRDVAEQMRKIGSVSVLHLLNEVSEPFQSPARMLRFVKRFLKSLMTEVAPVEQKEGTGGETETPEASESGKGAETQENTEARECIL